MADRVSSKDIPYRLTNSINIPRDAEQKLLRGWQEVARGQQPIVFINGRAKANPTLEQVIAEYEHSG